MLLTDATLILQDEVCYGIEQESRWPEISRVLIILAALTYPVVILRFISRYLIAHRVWWDDWCILATTVRCLEKVPRFHMLTRHASGLPDSVDSASIHTLVTHQPLSLSHTLMYTDSNQGFGRHFWDIRPERLSSLRKVRLTQVLTNNIIT